MLLERFVPLIPGALVTVVAATATVYLLPLDERGVDIVGEVEQGLPQPSMPVFDFEVMSTLVPEFQYQSGGETQAASITTALFIVLLLLFLTPLFYYLS